MVGWHKNNNDKSGSRLLAKTLLLLMAATTVGCGELGPDDFGAEDSPPPASAPSLSDPRSRDERLPPLPVQGDPEVFGEGADPAEVAAPATAAAVVDAPGRPGGNLLSIEPWKTGKESPRDLIPGNQRASASDQILPPVTAPTPELTPESAPVCPDAKAERDCRHDGGQWDDALCECGPGAR
jgi:hypothetical protein